MAGTSLFLLQIPQQVVFDELYFSTAWQTVFAIDNSFVIWGALLAFAILRRSETRTIQRSCQSRRDFMGAHDERVPLL